MATTKKKTTGKKIEQKITAPKKTSRKKLVRSAAGVETTENSFSDINTTEKSPVSKIFTRKYLYAVLVVLALIGILFAVSRMWIIAWVDNKPITKFELYSLLEKRDAGKTVEELVVQRLLLSEGQKQRQTVGDAEIEAEIKKIEEQQGGAEQLEQILSIQGLSREDFRKLVELQLLKQKLFGGGINITEEDVDKYIEENKASLPENILNSPESSEAAQLRDSVKEQLKQIKVNESFNNWLGETLNSSRVSRN